MSVISGVVQAGATEDAAQTQADASANANQLQYQMFQEQQKLMQPWVQSGQGNLERLNYAMYGQAPSPGGALIPDRGPMPQQADFTRQGTTGPWKWNPGSEAVPDVAAYQAALDKYNAQGSAPPTAEQMGGAPGRLSPDWRFSTQDWENSPEYAVYQGARDAAINRSQENLMAQGAASGMYGSGTMANALSQNMGQLYASYDPASLAAARQAAEGARTQEFNMLAGMSSPTGAQQVAQYAGQYGQQAGQNMIGAGNALAAGQVGAANAWGNAMSTGVNQLSNAYGQYRGQQNFNNWMNQPNVSTQYDSQGYGAPQYQFPASAYGQNQQWMQNSMSDFGG